MQIASVLPAPVRRIRGTVNLLGTLAKLALRDGDPVEPAYRLQQVLKEMAGPEELAAVRRALARDPVLRAMGEERWLPPSYALRDLASLPEGTLGRELHDLMVKNRLMPDFFPPFDPENELEYLSLRSQQTHDYWHVVTGYGNDEIGEVSIIGFYLGNFLEHHGKVGESMMVLPLLLIGTSFVRYALRHRDTLRPLLEGFHAGWTRGRATPSLLPVKWETLWHRPVDELRRELGLA